MPWRQPVPARQRPSGRVINLQQPANVPLRSAGPPGQLRGGRRAARAERLVQAQPLAKVHREKLQRPGHVVEQPVGQCRRRIGRVVLPGRAAIGLHAAQTTAVAQGTGSTATGLARGCLIGAKRPAGTTMKEGRAQH